MGRLFGDYGNGTANEYSGSVDDVATLTEHFTAAGLESLDKLLIQKDVRTWDSIDNGLSTDIRDHTISDIEKFGRRRPKPKVSRIRTNRVALGVAGRP